jgi:hypothetical protein
LPIGFQSVGVSARETLVLGIRREFGGHLLELHAVGNRTSSIHLFERLLAELADSILIDASGLVYFSFFLLIFNFFVEVSARLLALVAAAQVESVGTWFLDLDLQEMFCDTFVILS